MTVFKPSLGSQGGGAIAGVLALPYVVTLVLWACILWARDRVRHVLA